LTVVNGLLGPPNASKVNRADFDGSADEGNHEGVQYRVSRTSVSFRMASAPLRGFQKIRDAGRTYFEDLGKKPRKRADNPPSVPLSVKELKRRVWKLRRSFVVPGDDPVNEPTLRGKTEHLVFSRFSAEVKW
jgi:hypothetical protein